MIDVPQPGEPGYNFNFFELRDQFAGDPSFWEAQDLPNIEAKRWEREHGARGY